MIKFTIGLHTYKIDPPKLKDLYKIEDMQWYDGTMASTNIISYMSDCPVEKLLKLKNHEFAAIWTEVEKLFTEETPMIKQEIKLGKKDYGLLQMDKVTVAEWADVEMIVHDPKANKRTHELLAILYRPIMWRLGKHYGIEEYDSSKSAMRAELFLELPIADIKATTSFFLTTVRTSMEGIVNSLKKEMKELPQELQETLILSLQLLEPGTISSTVALEKILSNLKQQVDLLSKEPSTILPVEKTKQRKTSWTKFKAWLN